MPIFMDRHDIPGVTAEGVAAAHQEDLKIQHKYDCKGLTYWFDEDKGMAFCLIEAPNKDCVKKLHDDAHGLIPHQIIEVERDLVESFLGRIEDPEPAEKENTTNYLIINDPAFRAIMSIDLNDIFHTFSKLGYDGARNNLNAFKEIFTDELKKHNGRRVEHIDEGCMASFASVNQSVLCALAIQNALNKLKKENDGNKIYVRIGISAGVPVTGEDDFFGAAVRCARRLCTISSDGKILADSAINDLYNHNMLNTQVNDQSLVFLNPDDEKFIDNMMDIVERNWNDPLFGVETLRYQMGMSKSQLYRKLTSISGYTPSEFIKEYRLNKAIKAIERQKGNISGIAYESGFSSLSYFTKCFLKRFGMLPSKYANAIA